MIKLTKNKLNFIVMILFFLGSHVWAADSTCSPGWTQTAYTNSTTAYMLVTINGQPASEGDIVGAFVGEECRAFNPVSLYEGSAYATLVIAGTEAETVNFKIWDASECTVLDSKYTIQTNPGERMGLPPDYLPVSAGTAVKPILSLTPASMILPTESGTFVITIAKTGENGMNWVAEITGGDWLKIQGHSTGTDNGTITLVYDANYSNERNAEIKVSADKAENSPQSINVTQSAFIENNETENTVSLIPSSAIMEPGKTVSAEIRITAKNVWAVHVKYQAEPDMLELTGNGSYGDFIDPRRRFNITISSDTTESTWTGAQTLKHPAEPMSGEGIFAKGLKYKALSNVYGETRIIAEVTLTDKYGNLQPVKTIDAVININDGIHGGDGVIEGTVTYIDGSPVANADVTISLNGKDYTVTTDENGHYILDDLNDLNEGETYTVEAGKEGFYAEANVDSVENPVNLPLAILNTKLADLNKDGIVDIADFTLMANSYGTSEGEEGYDVRADIKSDGTINIQDLALLGSHWKI